MRFVEPSSFFNVSRSAVASSPNTMRPLHDTTVIRSAVRVSILRVIRPPNQKRKVLEKPNACLQAMQARVKSDYARLAKLCSSCLFLQQQHEQSRNDRRNAKARVERDGPRLLQ